MDAPKQRIRSAMFSALLLGLEIVWSSALEVSGVLEGGVVTEYIGSSPR